MPAPTIYDVAAKAGVSISTVSLCLNQPRRVADPTLRRVLAAADDLGYVPRAEVMQRARREVGRIGVIAPFSSYPTFGRRLNGIITSLAEQSLEVVVFDHESAAVSPLLAALPLTGRVDGLIVMSMPVDAAVRQRLDDQNVPVVLIDISQEGFDAVRTDDVRGGRLAARHLLDRGHTRIGFIGEGWASPHAHQSQCELRLAGLREEVTGAGLEVSDRHVHFTRHDFTAARATARALLGASDPPTAVFAHDDLLAAATVQGARDLGASVPGDLAVVGFDDSELAEVIGLTTVHQPFEASGELAANALVERIAKPSLPCRTIVLDLTLVERATT